MVRRWLGGWVAGSGSGVQDRGIRCLPYPVGEYVCLGSEMVYPVPHTSASRLPPAPPRAGAGHLDRPGQPAQRGVCAAHPHTDHDGEGGPGGGTGDGRQIREGEFQSAGAAQAGLSLHASPALSPTTPFTLLPDFLPACLSTFLPAMPRSLGGPRRTRTAATSPSTRCFTTSTPGPSRTSPRGELAPGAARTAAAVAAAAAYSFHTPGRVF